MNIVSSDVLVSIAPWPLIAGGQTYSLKIEGKKADGSSYELVIDKNRALTDGEVGSGPKRAVERLDLENLRDNSDFTLIFSVAFAPGMSDIAFPASSFRIVQEQKYDPLVLSGPSAAFQGDTLRFLATGGKPPYAYLSSNTAVARMTDALGNGVAVGPGTCVISVSDDAKNRATCDFKGLPPFHRVTPGRYYNVRPGQTYTFEVTGGTPPYRWLSNAGAEEVHYQNTSGPRVTVTTTARFQFGADITALDANGYGSSGLLLPPGAL